MQPFFRSMQWRLILILVLITFVLMTVIWVFLTLQVESITYSQFKEDIANNYEYLDLQELETADHLQNELTVNPIISGLIHGVDRSFTLIRQSTGEIVYSSDSLYGRDPQTFKAEIFRSANLIGCMSGSAESAERTFTAGAEGDFYDYARVHPLTDGDSMIVFFKYNRSRALEVLGRFNRVISYGVALALGIALLVAVFMSRTITKPIKDIMHKAESMTGGEFGQNLMVRSEDEIGELTRTFNMMSNRLNTMITEVSTEKNKVETIINHMKDGILAFSDKGAMLHENPSVRLLIGEQWQDGSFDSLMMQFGLDLRIAQLTTADEVRTETRVVQSGERFLRFQFAPFADAGQKVDGLVAVIQDITEEHKLDRMRRQFVADVSHELRTPLTSVKSYTETLLDGAVEDRDTAIHFLQVIDGETDRMARLVKDLLVLSQHDSGISLSFYPVNAAMMIDSCVTRLQMSADEKKISVKFENRCGDVLVLGDKDRLEQVFVNIVGNAVKYTPDGGRILILLNKDLQNVIVRVQDTGIGIPRQDLTRIFERFYRVDKARSRQMGGTGLGLAIAREIVEMHKGSVSANSPIHGDAGTEIVVKLPIFRSDM